MTDLEKKTVNWSWTLVDTELPKPVISSEAKSDGSSINARSSHGCSVVKDNLYVMGGEMVARTPVDSTMWTRNLAEKSGWCRMETKGDAPPARVAHAQASIGEDIYIFGGRQSITMSEAPLDDIWKLNIKNKSWTNITPKNPGPVARSFHKMIAVGKKLYVCGGCAAKGRLADLHSFDVETESWNALSVGPEEMAGRGGPGFLGSSDEKSLFVVGGFMGEESNAVYRYDIGSNKWDVLLAEKNEKIRPFSVSCGMTLPGKLIFFGGEVDPSENGHEGAGGFTADVVVLDDKTGLPVSSSSSSSSSPSPCSRGWSACAAWGDNKMVVYGGLSGTDQEPARLADTWVLEVK